VNRCEKPDLNLDNFKPKNILEAQAHIVSSEIYIYTPYAGATGMLLHINGKFTMGN
jgi:hypothetical protein